jgi:hypothetical protein
MRRFEDRWQARQAGAPQQPMVSVTVSEQVTVMVQPEKLWRLVWDPATSPLVSDDVVSAFTLPGTPAGQVGEMQMNVVACKNGTLVGTIQEVIELGPGYRAVTRDRSCLPSGTTTTLVLPVDQGGCVLRLRADQLVATESADAWRAQVQSHWLRYLTRVRELAEATLGPPGKP